MIVPFAAVAVQMLFQADVQREQELLFEAVIHQLQHIASSHLVSRVAVSQVADVIDAKIDSLFSDAPHLSSSEAISQMADDDSFRRDTFFSQQGDLFQGQFTKMSGVRPN